MTRASIIIRCYNEERHIGRLLSGIYQQSVKDFDVVVVDSGSTDATLSIAARYPVRIETIAKEEFSFGRSLNIGCAAAIGDFLVFASAHVYPLYDSWLEELLAPFSDERVALTYGQQRGHASTKFSEHQIFAKWFPEHSHQNQQHPFCNNANAAIRRSVWEMYPYDERLTGLEDLDWACRILPGGHQIAYVATAPIIHVHEESTAQTVNRYRREAIAYAHIFPDQKFGKWDFAHLLVRNVMVDYAEAARQGRILSNLIDIPRFRFAQFWGTLQGHQQRKPISQHLRERFYYPNGANVGAPSNYPGDLIDYSVENETFGSFTTGSEVRAIR